MIEGTTASDVPGVPEHGHSTSVGKGPALTIMDRTSIPARPLVEKLRQVAHDENIPIQSRRATTGGTDAGKIQLTKGGIPVAGISIPCRYIHSPASVASLGDIERLFVWSKDFYGGVDYAGDDQTFSRALRPCRPEDRVAAYIRDIMEPLVDEVYTDTMGSVVAVKRGRPKEKIMLAAHMDEIGVMIMTSMNRILRFSNIGGSRPLL